MYQSETKEFIIPAKPEVLIKLKDMIVNGEPGHDSIAKLIKGDVALYANVLAAANTPYFKGYQRVSSVQRAITLLGLDRLYAIVQMAMLRATLGVCGRLDLFWDYSTEVATISGRLAKHFKFISPDDAYTLGIMHESGVPLMIAHFNDYQSFFEGRGHYDLADFYCHEQMKYQIDHFEVSARLAKTWGVPDLLCEAIVLQPHLEDVLMRTEYDEQLKDTLSLLVLAKEISLSFRTLWKPDDEDDQHESLEPIMHHFGLTESDLQVLRDDVFDSLELDDHGLVPS